jgi:hypothetical protein
MRPMLDGLELPLVQEISSYDRRTLAEHKPPGMSGHLLQNLGRRPARLVLWGVAAGPDAPGIIEELEKKFRAAKPVPFTADIAKDSEIELMLIDDLKLQELAGKPDRIGYQLTLREFIEPVEPAIAGPSLDTDILGDALNQLDNLTSGLEVLTQLSDVIARLAKLTEELQQQSTRL